VPDRALHEDAVLVERDELAERLRIELLGEERVRRPVPLEDAMRNEPVGRSLLAHLLGRLAEGERLRLREDVRHQEVVMVADRVERSSEADEVRRNELRTLVDQLVEGVLAVR